MSAAALPLALLGLGVIHLWALRQQYCFAEGEGPQGTLRDQPWAQAWFPAAAFYFNWWLIYTILDSLFLKPRALWQLPPPARTAGDMLFLLAVTALTAAYAFRHLRSLPRHGMVPKLRLWHAIHGFTGLMLFLGIQYLLVRGVSAALVLGL